MTSEGSDRSTARTKPSPSTRVWLVLAAVSVVLFVCSALAGGVLLGDILLMSPLAFVLWPPIGTLLVLRRPENPIGRLMIALSIFMSLTNATETYVFMSQAGLVPTREVVAWVSVWIFTPVYSLAVVIIALFPSGRLASRWLKWPLQTAVVLAAVSTVGMMFLPGTIVAVSGWEFDNPWGLGQLEFLGPVLEVLYTTVILIMGLATVDLFFRWKRSSGAERLQMRALTLVLALLVAVLVLGNILRSLGMSDETWYVFNWAGNTALAIAAPLALGMAISRYRLYEIDRIISRTVSYGLVVGLLAGVFFGTVTLLTTLLPAESDMTVAASTLAAAALFNPLRRRVRRRVDRRFNRSRYDAEKEIEAFIGSLRHAHDLGEITGDMLAVVNNTMEPATVSVWVKGELHS